MVGTHRMLHGRHVLHQPSCEIGPSRCSVFDAVQQTDAALVPVLAALGAKLGRIPKAVLQLAA
eukprot:9471293-Pyramimonas_sp.AAC.1